jgi:hypothetical protein
MASLTHVNESQRFCSHQTCVKKDIYFLLTALVFRLRSPDGIDY